MERLKLKPQYLEEMILDMRNVIKENTVDISIIDMQAEVVFFSLKKFMEYLDSDNSDSLGEQEEMRNRIFREASLAMQDLHPMWAESDDRNPISDAREWYDDASWCLRNEALSQKALRLGSLCEMYFDTLSKREPSKAMQLMAELHRY